MADSRNTYISGIPFALTPSSGSTWSTDAASAALRVSAAPHSDIFVDPTGAAQVNAETMLNAVTLLGEVPDGDFQLRARVEVEFAATFDAGVLLLWFDDRHWAKLCFEYSPDREPMVVSVVCRDVADDANSFVVEGGAVWLRIARAGGVYAFHASLDGVTWRFVRVFALEADGVAPRIGFEAQSPTGEGCDVAFSDVSFLTASLADMRDGS
jgi:regulation of enolase protein 1 (concanavalin A-like superfamily)